MDSHDGLITETSDSELIRLDCCVLAKPGYTQPRSVITAIERILESNDKTRAPRGPIKVTKMDSNESFQHLFWVIDGNATVCAARALGWTLIPAEIAA